MIKQPEFKNCLFIFNDNVEYHMSNRKGAGNAIIRQYNKHSQRCIGSESYSNLEKPMSAGISTGTI